MVELGKQIKAKYKAGEISKEDVIKALPNTDLHTTSVWQCIFEDDNEICDLLELNHVKHLVEDVYNDFKNEAKFCDTVGLLAITTMDTGRVVNCSYLRPQIFNIWWAKLGNVKNFKEVLIKYTNYMINMKRDSAKKYAEFLPKDYAEKECKSYFEVLDLIQKQIA